MIHSGEFMKIFACLILCFLFSGRAFAQYRGVINHPFKNADGIDVVPKTLESKSNKTKGYLISFWASWCAPCKAEMKRFVKNKDRLEDWSIIAVNVDDLSDWQSAKGFLRQIKWPFHSVIDAAGEHFYGVHASGDLPLTLRFSSKGKFKKSYGDFQQKHLDKVLKLKLKKDKEELGISGSHIIKSQRRNGTGKDPTLDDSYAIVARHQVSYESDFIDVRLTLDQLLQRQPNDTEFAPYEDELGASYVLLKDLKNEELKWSLRLGSHQLQVMEGLVSSVKTDREQGTNLRLIGGLGHLFGKRFSLKVGYGLIVNNLFPSLLDPVLDQSSGVREQYLGSLESVLSIYKSEDVKVSGVVGFGHLRQLKNEINGFQNSTRKFDDNESDFRAGLGLLLDIGALSFSNYYSHFNRTDGDAGRNVHSNLTLSFSDDDLSGRLIVGWMLTDKPVEHLFIPFFTDEFATPLTNTSKNNFKVSTSFSDKRSFQPSLEIFFAREDSIETSDPDAKNDNFGFKFGSGKLNLKFQGSYTIQDLPVTPNLSYYEQIYLLTSSVIGHYLGVRAEWRSRKNDTNFGLSSLSGKRVAAGLLSQFDFSGLTATASYDIYLQDGEYKGTSGLDKGLLQNGRITIKHAAFGVDMIYGQQPGGIVCTAGSCSFRSPYDGWEAQLNANWAF